MPKKTQAVRDARLTTPTDARKSFVQSVEKTKSVEQSPPREDIEIDRDAIAHRAKEIYERNGCKEGKDDENWLQAERELREVASS